MTIKQQRKRSRRNRRDNRGSALLVSLMVIVGLSLLGLGFVAISETETAIAKNQQNAAQTQAIAEAGAKAVVEWFQDPIWSELHAAMPKNDVSLNANINAIKTTRVIGGATPYTGVYKPLATTRLLDLPFRPSPSNRFYGDEDNADIIINRTTDATTIDAFNDFLLLGTTNSRLGGEVTEIRIFAPPIVGGTLVNGFWVLGSRFGVATIKVTAQQFRLSTGTTRTGVIASHSVRIVVGEIPLPIPGGPVQSNTSISFGGNLRVHWGNETSAGTLNNVRAYSSIPWANAYDRAHFERGYEAGTSISSIAITNGGTGYVAAPTVTIAAPAAGTTATATATLTAGVVTGVTIATRGSGYKNEPGTSSWGPTVTFSAPPAGTTATGIAYIGAEAWPITGALFDEADYFHEILGKSYIDPWFGERAVGDNMEDGAGSFATQTPQCFPYDFSRSEAASSNQAFSFQWQSTNLWPSQKQVIFPSIKYDFWKRITSQARGYKGLYYFTNDGSNAYRKFGVGASKAMCTWVNSKNPAGLGSGVFFFDSKDNATNPQLLTGNPKKAALSGSEAWNSSSFGVAGGPSFLMQGFIYMNVEEYGTTGVGGYATPMLVNMPGEPWRDVGYPKWDTTTSTWDTSCAAGATNCFIGMGDGVFSYQDLNNNGRFDVVTMSSPSWDSHDTYGATTATPYAAGATFVPKTWKASAQAIADYGAACTILAAGFNGTNPAANDCSEPHEPYLNLVYTTTAGSASTQGWEANATQTFTAKITTSATSNTAIACTSANTQGDCASNAHDADGPLVNLDIILNGVLYNEGDYRSQGNVHYFGSLLIYGDVNGTGTPDVWFDEKLTKGTWSPPGMPRVMVFSMQTDEQSQ